MSDSIDVTSPNAGLRVRDDVVWREIDGEIVLLDLAGNAYYTLTSSGTILWPSLVAGSTPAALADLLIAHFSLDHDQAAGDTRAFLASLGAQGLLEPV